MAYVFVGDHPLADPQANPHHTANRKSQQQARLAQHEAEKSLFDNHMASHYIEDLTAPGASLKPV